MSDSERTIEYVVEVIRKMPYQFTLRETEKFTSLLNERLDEILKIHKAENKCNPNDCPHPYGTYKTCIKCKEECGVRMVGEQERSE